MHTHHAQALVYVLEGTIVMQVKGGTPVTLVAGQTFYEGVDDVHVVGRNASQTAPAKFFVFGEGQGCTSSDAGELTYRFYETRGRRHGEDLDDWLAAERELTRHYRDGFTAKGTFNHDTRHHRRHRIDRCETRHHTA